MRLSKPRIAAPREQTAFCWTWERAHKSSHVTVHRPPPPPWLPAAPPACGTSPCPARRAAARRAAARACRAAVHATRVSARRPQQSSTHLHHHAVMQDGNLVGARHRGQAVRYDEHGAASTRVGQRSLHRRLGGAVQRRGGFIQQQHTRVLRGHVTRVTRQWLETNSAAGGRACSTARAMAMRCFWPPLSCTPRSPTCVAYPAGRADTKA